MRKEKYQSQFFTTHDCQPPENFAVKDSPTFKNHIQIPLTTSFSDCS